MSNNRFWLTTIIKQQWQAHFMYLQMDPLDNPLSTRPIQTGREFCIEPYPNGWFGFVYNLDCQFGAGSVPTWTRTWSDGPDPFLTLSLSDLASSEDEEDGKTRMMMKKIQSLASWAKMMNLAGGWAQSPKWYSTAWRAFGRSRWGLTNWHNRDGGTQPTTSVREIWSMGQLNWRFRQLWSPKQTRQQPHLPWEHLESLCWVLISSPDNPKCRKWCLNREVVKWGWVGRNLRQTIT